ncbi:MAG: T9SS type A sorting domain-containing protein [candidate division WOR-3 bacterium]
MKKLILITGLAILFSFVSLYAENNINGNAIKSTPTPSTKIEGTIDENLPVIPHEKVQGSLEYELPMGVKYLPPNPPLDNSILPNPDDPTSNNTYPGYTPVINKPRNEHSQIFDGPRWGNDILIDDKEVGEGQDFDEDEVDHAIYVAFDTYHSTNDSLVVYKSTNGGDTWNLFIIGLNTDGYIGNPKVRVVRDAGGQSWVVFLGIWYEPTGARQLWSRRVRTDGTGATFEQIAADSVLFADIDGDIGTGAWCYCTYSKIEPDGQYQIWTARNALDGTGWQNNSAQFVNMPINPYPAIAAGAGGNVGIAFIDSFYTTTQEVRIKRSTNYGQSWLNSEPVSNNAGAAILRYPDIGYTHGSTQTGWIFVTFKWPTEDNIAYYYSTNSGVNWTYGTVITPATANENMSTLRCYKSTGTGAITVAYNCDPGDSTMFTWAMSTTPTNFDNGVKINDYGATGLWPPTAGWVTHGGIYSAIIYSAMSAGYRPYFDWFGNTGIAEENKQVKSLLLSLSPNPSNGPAKLSYTTKNPGIVKISLYDESGRLIDNIVNETKSAGTYTLNLDNRELPNGIYFVRVETPEGTATKTMTIVR